jgi:ribosomal protein L11 methyltransferase
MAFGTGHHGTTKGCLEAYDRLLTDGFMPRSVADIGAGTAVLAIAAAKTAPNPVIASDIDPVAVEVAEANARANDVAGKLRCIEAEGFDHPDLAAGAPYDLIFANILKGPLIALAPDMRAQMADGGYAILSGILNEQADEVIAAYAAQGFRLVARDRLGDWTTITISP